MFEDGLLVWKFKGGSKDALRAIYEKYAEEIREILARRRTIAGAFRLRIDGSGSSLRVASLPPPYA